MSSETVAICTRKQDVRATKMELRKLILFRKWFRLRKGVRQTCKLKKFFLCILKKKNFCVETFYNVLSRHISKFYAVSPYWNLKMFHAACMHHFITLAYSISCCKNTTQKCRVLIWHFCLQNVSFKKWGHIRILKVRVLLWFIKCYAMKTWGVKV